MFTSAGFRFGETYVVPSQRLLKRCWHDSFSLHFCWIRDDKLPNKLIHLKTLYHFKKYYVVIVIILNMYHIANNVKAAWLMTSQFSTSCCGILIMFHWREHWVAQKCILNKRRIKKIKGLTCTDEETQNLLASMYTPVSLSNL